MNQQINLYQPMFRKQKKVFSAITMLQVCGFFIVVLAVIYLYNIKQLQPFRDELTKTQRELGNISNQIAILEAKLPKQTRSKLLEDEIIRLTKELEERQAIKTILSGGSLGNTRGFSGYFEAIAKQHINGTWLTEINIKRGGISLGLSGKTISADLVPVYLKSLNIEPVFNEIAFNKLDVERSGDDLSILNFNVHTDIN